MTLTAITATYERPVCFKLCEQQMARQTRQPDQWLVLDGPDPMPTKILEAVEGGKITGDVVVLFEDDDAYRPDWLEWCEAEVGKGFELVGEGNLIYFNVAYRWWGECRNVRHAANCQTAFHSDFLPTLASVIKSYNRPWFDTRVWEVDVSKSLFLPKHNGERHVIGIKGMTGRAGYSDEHRSVAPAGCHVDPSIKWLWDAIGPAAERYLPFSRQKR